MSKRVSPRSEADALRVRRERLLQILARQDKEVSDRERVRRVARKFGMSKMEPRDRSLKAALGDSRVVQDELRVLIGAGFATGRIEEPLNGGRWVPRNVRISEAGKQRLAKATSDEGPAPSGRRKP